MRMCRLESGFYGSVEAWRADVDLVWNNAMRFNEPTNDVHECAKKLAQAFDRMMRQASTGAGVALLPPDFRFYMSFLSEA
jgi:hypothetical protein